MTESTRPARRCVEPSVRNIERPETARGARPPGQPPLRSPRWRQQRREGQLIATNHARARCARCTMSFARHGAMANLESTLAQRHAQFVTSQPVVTTHEDDDLQYMRSSFHAVRDSMLGASRPAAAATFSAASGQRRSPPKAADRVPDYSIALPVSRPARALGLLLDPDEVPILVRMPCSCACTYRISAYACALQMHCTRSPRAPSLFCTHVVHMPTRRRATPSTFLPRPPEPRPEPPPSALPTPPEPHPQPAFIARNPPASALPTPPEPTLTARVPPPSGLLTPPVPLPKPALIARVPPPSALPTPPEPAPEPALIARATARRRICTTRWLIRRAKARAPGRPRPAARLAARPTSSRSGRLATAPQLAATSLSYYNHPLVSSYYSPNSSPS